jgi:hypothetical protein
MKIWLNYSKEDFAIVEAIQNDLGQSNLEISFIDLNLNPGDLIIEKVIKSIKNANVYLIFISRNSEKNKYFLSDIGLILSELKKDVTKKIIPIVLDKDVVIPPFLNQFQTLDFSKAKNRDERLPLINSLIDSIRISPESSISEGEILNNYDNFIKTGNIILEEEKKDYKKESQLKFKKLLFFLLIYFYILLVIFVIFTSINFIHIPISVINFFIGILFGIMVCILIQMFFSKYSKKNGSLK